MTSLKAAVIGVGSMGRNHARVYRELAETELVAVADPNPQVAEGVARDQQARAYGDYRAMLAAELPDIVSVVVPTEQHFEVATAALEAGCHVLVEKPITSTVEQGLGLIAHAEALGRQLMVGHIVRFDPAVQELKRRLDANELGRIFQVRSQRLGPFPARVRDVGVVIDLATHDVDITSYVTGQPIVRVYAETQREIHSSHEDLLIGTLRLASGAVGLLEINWLTPTKTRTLTITGERGMFVVDYLMQDLYYYENQEALPISWDQISMIKGVSEGRMIRYPINKMEPLKIELQAFAQSIIAGAPAPVSGREGLAALRTALALVRSGLEHRPVTVEHEG